MNAVFVDLAHYDPALLLEPRYAGDDNFLGRPVTGYQAPMCLLTLSAACSLSHAARLAASFGLAIKVFDAYRPQRAVDDFVRWAADESDQRNKRAYYPGVDKRDLFRLGYIAAASSHSRGSSVDVTLVPAGTGGRPVEAETLLPNGELDMGTPFDFFGVESHPAHEPVTEPVRRHRRLLAAIMEAAGFAGIAEEWWHFTLVDEPFPNTYFDFPVAPMGWLYQRPPEGVLSEAGPLHMASARPYGVERRSGAV